jgi:hypothetical protein
VISAAEVGDLGYNNGSERGLTNERLSILPSPAARFFLQPF